MSEPICIPVDVTNPGQFFACCGLLELAHRLRPGVEGKFTDQIFHIEQCGPRDPVLDFAAVASAFKKAPLVAGTLSQSKSDIEDDDEGDAAGGNASTIFLGHPFEIMLDWWADKSLKPWAGSMNAVMIFEAMRASIDDASTDPLNDLGVVNDPPDSSCPKKKTKKREPFYFDSRRGGNAKSLDVGFAPDAFNMTSAACPAVESLCMIGLQRFRPMPTGRPREFEYQAWTVPLAAPLAAAACGRLPCAGGERYSFENAFRTDQRKHKGFLPAIRINQGDTP